MWPERDRPDPLGPEAMHVWSFPLDLPGDDVARALRPLLSPDERARADRFRFPRDRTRFTVARAGLRRLLGAYLGDPPEGLVFRYGPRGKPALDRPGPALEFNLSHAGGWALVAVVQDRAIGVDLEPVRTGIAFERIARSFFSPEETAALLSLPETERPRGFFNGWTRKEAFIKARGDGLSLPLDQFVVTLRPGEPARLQTTRWDPNEAARWRLYALDPAPGLVGALAVEGLESVPRCAVWTGVV